MTKQKRGRLAGSPQEMTVQVMEEGRIVDKTISDSKTCRFLGANMQNSLAWQHHLETGPKAVLPACRKQLGEFYSLRDLIPQKAKLQLVNSLIISKLVYLIPLWGSATANYLRKAQTLLNKSARFITKGHRKTRTNKLMAECNWMSMTELIEYHSLMHLWKILKLKTPVRMFEEYSITEDYTISTTQPRLQLTASSFKWRMTDKWNSLPVFMRTEKKLLTFKKQLKTIITERRPPEPD